MENGARHRVKLTCWQLDYTFTPCGLYRVGSSAVPWRPRKARTSHLYPPGTTVWEDTLATRKPFHFAFVAFRGEEPFLRDLVKNSQGFARFLDPQGQLGGILAAIAKIASERRETGFWQANGRLCEAFELLRRATPVEEGVYRLAPRGAQEPEATELSAAVDAYLQRNLHAPLTVAMVAKALGLGESTLLHRYRMETGGTLMKQFMRQRIAAARNLLLQGHAVKNVTKQLGFWDEAHFSRTFRRYEGVSPSAFAHAASLHDADGVEPVPPEHTR